MNTIKAELRKLYTVRSTYVLSILGIIFVIFYAFYGVGYRMTGEGLSSPDQIMGAIVVVLTSLPLLLASIIAILFMTHEYRYTTIMYTLTAANSRTKILLAKIAALTCYVLPYTAILVALTALMVKLGVAAHGNKLVAQTIPLGSLAWQSLFYGWASLMVALAIAVIIRSQVGAIVALFVIPTIELPIGVLLKDNAVYLPFTSSNYILATPITGTLSHGNAALVFGSYLVVAWIVAWFLFLRRDAN